MESEKIEVKMKENRVIVAPSPVKKKLNWKPDRIINYPTTKIEMNMGSYYITSIRSSKVGAS